MSARVFSARSLEEALAELEGARPETRVLAGGTDLMPNMKHEIVEPEVVVGLWRIPGLKGVRVEEGALHIGATDLDLGLKGLRFDGLDTDDRVPA